MFDEEQNVILGADLAVDDIAGDGKPFDADSLPAGSTFSGHYVFFDPPQTDYLDTTLMTGCVEFDSPVAFEENALCTAIKTRGRRFGVYCF